MKKLEHQPKPSRSRVPRPEPETAASCAKYVVLDTDSVQTALLSIDYNEHRTVVVTNADNVVVGVLSDGDARKSLLDGRLLSTPVHRVMNTDFVSVGLEDVAKARELLTQGHIFVIPVVDSQGALLEILTSA